MADDEVVIKFSQQDAESVGAAIQGVQEQLNRLASAFGAVATAEGAASAGATELGGETKNLGEKMNNAATVGGSLADQMFALRMAFGRASDSAKSLGQLLSQMYSALRTATTGLTGAAVGAGALVGAFQMVISKATNVSQAAYETAKSLSVMSGMSIEAADNLANAFALAGSSTSSLSLAFFRMSAEIDEGGKKLAKYGIETKDAFGNLKTEGQLLLEVRDRLSDMGSATSRNAAAIDIFGRAGRGMIDILSVSRDKFKELQGEADKNQGMTKALAESTREYNQATEKLRQSWEGLWLTIGPKVIEIAKRQVEMIQQFVEGLKSIAAWIDKYGKLSPAESAAQKERDYLREGYADYDAKMAARGNAWSRFWDAQKQAQKEFGEGARLMQEADNAAAEKHADYVRQRNRENLTDEQKARTAHAEAYAKEKRMIDEANAAAASMVGMVQYQPRLPTDEERRANEFRLRSRAETADKIVQIEASMQAEIAKLITDRELPAAQIQTAALEKRIAIEKELQTEIARRRAIILEQEKLGEAIDKPGKEALEKEAVANATKLMELQAARANARRKEMEAETADHRKELEQRLADAKSASERELAMRRYYRDQWMAYLEENARSQREIARGQQRLDEDLAKEEYSHRVGLIDAEIASLRRLASLHQENAALQQDVHNKVVALSNDRVNAEMDANRRIYESRKQLAEKNRQIALEEAALGGDVFAAARARLEKRGVTVFTAEMIQNEVLRMAQAVARAREVLGMGGGVSGEQVDLMQQFARMQQSHLNARTQALGQGGTLQAFLQSLINPQALAGPIQVGGMPDVDAAGLPRRPGTPDVAAAMGSFQKSVSLASTTLDTFKDVIVKAITDIGNSLAQLPSVLSGGVRGEGYTSITFPKDTTGPMKGTVTVPQYAEGAWDVPSTGPAVVHAGEMVVPRDEADFLRRFANPHSPPATEADIQAQLSHPLNLKDIASARAYTSEMFEQRLEEWNAQVASGRGMPGQPVSEVERLNDQLRASQDRLFSAKTGLSALRGEALDAYAASRGVVPAIDPSLMSPAPKAFDLGRWTAPTWDASTQTLTAGRMGSSVEESNAGGSGGVSTPVPVGGGGISAHADVLKQGYTGAIQAAEKEMAAFEQRMSARLKKMNESIRDHMINLIKTELPQILQQQGARR